MPALKSPYCPFTRPGKQGGRQVVSPHPDHKYPQLARNWPSRWGDTKNPRKPIFEGVFYVHRSQTQ